MDARITLVDDIVDTSNKAADTIHIERDHV